MGPWRGLRPTSRHIPSYIRNLNTVMAPATTLPTPPLSSTSSSPSVLPSPPLPSPTLPSSPPSSSIPHLHGAILGWGSHEFLQLGSHTVITDQARGLQPTAMPLKVFETGTISSSSSLLSSSSSSSSFSSSNHHHHHIGIRHKASSHPLGPINPPLHATHCNQVSLSITIISLSLILILTLFLTFTFLHP